MKRLLASCLAITAIALIAPSPAVAASLLINDALPGENIAFSMNDFEGGFILDGTLVQSGRNSPVTVTVAETNTAGAPIIHTFSATWITEALTPSSGVIAFAEGSLCCSDILTFTYIADFGTGILRGTFVSDVDPGLLPLPAEATVVSEGTPFVFNNGNITASAISDGPETRVPEPGTFLLLGSGFAGLLAARRWRHRRK
jgi:PEP-CTERM motif